MPPTMTAIPQFVSACGFANARAAGYEAGDFLAAAVARALRRRSEAGARLHRHPRRSFRQAPGAAGSRARRRGRAVAPLRLARRAARGRPLPRACRAPAALRLDRQNGSEGAAARPARPEAELESRCLAGAEVAAAEIGGTPRGACG